MFAGELEILKLLEGIRTDTLNKVFEYITMLGEEIPMVFIIAILYFAFDKKIAQKIFYITVTSLGFNGIIKNIIKLPRPFATNQVSCVRPDTATGYSFPSGHTQNFATWSSVVAMKLKKTWINIVAAILIILVAFSRIFLGAHFPSDVIIGAIVGILFGILGYIGYDKFEDKRKLYFATILILTPFALGFMIKPDMLFADFYKAYGMIIGLLLAVMCEEKYAPLEYDVAWWKKVIRVVLAIVIAFIIKEGIKMLNVFGGTLISLVIDTIRYMLLIFVVFGICPLLFKRFKI